MDLQRAREIMQSSDTINVMYMGEPIWLESVNENDNTVFVSFLNSSREDTVKVDSLQEKRQV